MECVDMIDISGVRSQPTSGFIPPTMKGNECYHVFLSYSSTDNRWTEDLLVKLENAGLKVCVHERDFVAGVGILENMSNCIEESQKVLLVLSAEFLRSRWCLTEANMSLFINCLQQKPIVPVLLESDVRVPLQLCHLTYIKAEDPDFMNKLLHVLCTPNRDLRGSSVVPYQPPSVYNGKALLPLRAVNEETLHSWDSGVFSNMDIPDQLRLVISNQDTYKQAIGIINNVSQTQVWLRPLWKRVLIYCVGVFFVVFYGSCDYFVITLLMTSYPCFSPYHKYPNCDGLYVYPILCCALFSMIPVTLLIQLCRWKWEDHRRIIRELQKAVGQANVLLYKEKVLMGCRTNSEICLLYVSLDSCRQEFEETFSRLGCSEEMFDRAITFFSSGYTCCLTKKHFPFTTPPSTEHLPGLVCFCQYVSQQLDKDQWVDEQ